MFGFLKKKKSPEVKVTFESRVMDTPPEYDPWDASQGNSDTEYANTIFLNMHSRPTPYPESPDDFARYVSYDLGIHDPIKKFKDMLAAGFLKCADKADILNTLKVAELKDILQAHDLPTKGKKAELIETIVESIKMDDLKLPELYTVSEKGVEYIGQHEDFLKLFRNPYNISYEEYAEAKAAAPPYLKYNDIIWGIFNKREFKIPLHHNGGRRNNALHRAMFLKSENRLVDALDQYITVLYFDVNDYIISEERHAEFIAKYGADEDEKPYPFKIAPSVQDEILNMKDLFENDMIERAYRHHVDPAPKLPQDAFKRLVVDLLTGIEIEIDTYYKIKR